MLNKPNQTQIKPSLNTTETWVFDLDNTLYPASCNLFRQVERNITNYVMQALGLDRDAAYSKQKALLMDYGTTMSGMMHQHGTDPDDYLAFVHDIDLSPISPAPELDRALNRLEGRKVIFTNGSSDHATNVTDKLGISHHFDGVFDIIDAGYTPKPHLSVYEKMLAHFKIEPVGAVMVEDMARNLVPAAALGMTTVWVRTDSAWAIDSSDGDHIHHVIDDLVGWLEELAPS